jgi:hypothetical protein
MYNFFLEVLGFNISSVTNLHICAKLQKIFLCLFHYSNSPQGTPCNISYIYGYLRIHYFSVDSLKNIVLPIVCTCLVGRKRDVTTCRSDVMCT